MDQWHMSRKRGWKHTRAPETPVQQHLRPWWWRHGGCRGNTRSNRTDIEDVVKIEGDTPQKPYRPSPSAGSQGTWFRRPALPDGCAVIGMGPPEKQFGTRNLVRVCVRARVRIWCVGSLLYIESMHGRVKRCNWHVVEELESMMSSSIDTYT